MAQNNYQQQQSPTQSNDDIMRAAIKNIIDNGLDFSKINAENSDYAKAYLSNAIYEYVQRNSNTKLSERLEIYWKYEEHYLKVLKEYKEELKFVAALQEDLRKERAKFFAETLKEVSKTLSETKVDQGVQNAWIQNLVQSYTQSLDMSSELVQETAVQTMADIKKGVDEVKETATKTEK